MNGYDIILNNSKQFVKHKIESPVTVVEIFVSWRGNYVQFKRNHLYTKVKYDNLVFR